MKRSLFEATCGMTPKVGLKQMSLPREMWHLLKNDLESAILEMHANDHNLDPGEPANEDVVNDMPSEEGVKSADVISSEELVSENEDAVNDVSRILDDIKRKILVERKRPKSFCFTRQSE